MNNKKGFTLVEIMIVVVIIGLLAAMAIPAFQQVRQSSQENAALNDLRQIAAGADTYFLENGGTSVTTTALVGTYIKTLSAGNTYPTTVNSTDASLTATTKSGDVVTYEM